MESALQKAAGEGMDEFIQVFTDKYKEIIGGELTADTMPLLTGEQHSLLAYQIFRDEIMLSLIHIFNAARIARRVMEGGHDVPITKIISRYDKSIANCCIVSEFADRAYIYDNSIKNMDAQLLFRLRNGKLVKQYVDVIPRWVLLGYANNI